MHHCLFLLFAALGLIFAGCSKSSTTDGPAKFTSYTITGSLIVADVDRGTLTIKYNAVPGVIEAGAGDFRASEATIAAARPGVRFSATVVKKGGSKWLEDFRIGDQ